MKEALSFLFFFFFISFSTAKDVKIDVRRFSQKFEHKRAPDLTYFFFFFRHQFIRKHRLTLSSLFLSFRAINMPQYNNRYTRIAVMSLITIVA